MKLTGWHWHWHWHKWASPSPSSRVTWPLHWPPSTASDWTFRATAPHSGNGRSRRKFTNTSLIHWYGLTFRRGPGNFSSCFGKLVRTLPDSRESPFPGFWVSAASCPSTVTGPPLLWRISHRLSFAFAGHLGTRGDAQEAWVDLPLYLFCVRMSYVRLILFVDYNSWFRIYGIFLFLSIRRILFTYVRSSGWQLVFRLCLPPWKVHK